MNKNNGCTYPNCNCAERNDEYTKNFQCFAPSGADEVKTHKDAERMAKNILGEDYFKQPVQESEEEKIYTKSDLIKYLVQERIGNTISGLNALSISLGKTIESVITEEINNTSK